MKKIFSMAVVFCLAMVGAMFVSCENEQKSSYQYEVALDNTVNQDARMCADFELVGHPIIYAEMEKVSDQRGSLIFKDTRANADKRAKEAFHNGVEKLRKETNSSFEGLIIVLNVADPDTNKPIQVDKVTL